VSDDVTDFSTYSHSQLRQMVEALNSGDVMAASDPWRRAAATLKQIRTSLGTASGTATQNWQGSTSDAFYGAMTKLATNVNNTAAYANDAANTLQLMSEAIDQAKHDMPEEPGFWDQLGNAISDTVQNTVGAGDDSTNTPIADQRKAQAAAVMQTLANKYRTAIPVLKPPQLSGIEDPSVPPPDPTAAAALSAFVMGAGAGAIGGYATAPETRQAVPRAVTTGTSAPMSSQVSAPPQAGPTDAGIKGGVPNSSPKAPKSVAIGSGTPPASSPQGGSTSLSSGTGLDHMGLAGRNPVISTGGAPSAMPGGPGPVGAGPFPVGLGVGAGRGQSAGERGSRGALDEPLATGGGRPVGGSAPREGVFTGEGETTVGPGGGRAAGSASGARDGVFADEEAGMPGGRLGAGLRGGGAGRRRFGTPGEPEPVAGSAGGAAREEAFTEGGTGLGARSRAAAERAGEAAAEGGGMFPGGARDTQRKKKRSGKRADYLVEDEETWVSGEDASSGVVE
jgi:uncharacterized protein YukE